MGYHTWFYTKTEFDTKEKFLAFAKQECLKHKKIYPDDQYNQVIDYAIENQLDQVVFDYLCSIMRWSVACTYHNGAVYNEVVEYYNIFRVSSQTEIKLYSFENTLDFIDYNADINSTLEYDVLIAELKQFWETYPNGLIEFS